LTFRKVRKGEECAFALSLLSLQWPGADYGYEVTSNDVWAAYTHTTKAARQQRVGGGTRYKTPRLIGATNLWLPAA